MIKTEKSSSWEQGFTKLSNQVLSIATMWEGPWSRSPLHTLSLRVRHSPAHTDKSPEATQSTCSRRRGCRCCSFWRQSASKEASITIPPFAESSSPQAKSRRQPAACPSPWTVQIAAATHVRIRTADSRGSRWRQALSRQAIKTCYPPWLCPRKSIFKKVRRKWPHPVRRRKRSFCRLRKMGALMAITILQKTAVLQTWKK